MVPARIFQEEDVFAVLAEGDVQGIVRIDAPAAALEPVDVRSKRADVPTVVHSVDANVAVAIRDEEVFAAGVNCQGAPPP